MPLHRVAMNNDAGRGHGVAFFGDCAVVVTAKLDAEGVQDDSKAHKCCSVGMKPALQQHFDELLAGKLADVVFHFQFEERS